MAAAFAAAAEPTRARSVLLNAAPAFVLNQSFRVRFLISKVRAKAIQAITGHFFTDLQLNLSVKGTNGQNSNDALFGFRTIASPHKCMV